MVAEISTATRTEVLEAVRGRYREASKRDKTRMLNEFVAMVGCHRKTPSGCWVRVMNPWNVRFPGAVASTTRR